MKKKVDIRIKTLIENGLKTRQRTLFVIIGDRGRDQVVNFHYLLSKMSLKTRPKVLWCYKKELGFSTHRKKRMNEVKKQLKKGLYDPDLEEPFDLFITSSEIRYCFYKETQNILGNTFSMLILQDFESLTPNILCRTIETVEGGGIIIMLLKTMTSLKQLYTMTMDIHSRFRTESHADIRPLFNERMILSLGVCKNCLVMDDELNILPISSLTKDITPVSESDSIETKATKELNALKESLKQNKLLGPIVSIAKTLDQAKVIMSLFEALTEKTVRYTVSVTAGRGRGKSAAVGISIAAAIACGYSSIFVTAPSPENLKTLFEFIFMGLDNLDYKEHQHYEIIQSTNPEFNKAVVRVNIFKNHKQVIQYIMPQDSNKISQTDLMVIDEASAIPLPLVKNLFGPYVIFMCSTVNGYEGTGRSLSLKLIQKIREQSRMSNEENRQTNKSGSGVRLLSEATMTDPIRYASNDPIEKWLYDLLALNATTPEPLKSGLPHPNDCELFLVNRETLFSFHKATEKFLYQLMTLFVSSHYKNSPNDLQLLSDAPAHAIFVLLGPINQNSENKGKNEVPDILCAVQVCFEGKISKSSVIQSNDRGLKPSGDLVPWTVYEQYQDNDFPQLNGVRIVRIATHSLAQKMGYGSRALELLEKFFDGQMIGVNEDKPLISFEKFDRGDHEEVSKEDNGELLTENVQPKKKLQPILKKLGEIQPPPMDYLSVSFGINIELYNFWKKNGFSPVYIRQTVNETTGENSCIMIKPLQNSLVFKPKYTLTEQRNDEATWVQAYTEDFKKRFLNLLSYEFKSFDVQLVLSILDPNLTTKVEDQDEEVEDVNFSHKELERHINLYDLKRLEAYAANISDYHLITDLVPTISKLFFLKLISKQIKLSYAQAAILIGMGLQHKYIEAVATELKLPISQALALFNKAVRKFTQYFKKMYQTDIEKGMKKAEKREKEFNPLKKNTDHELEEEGQQVVNKIQKTSDPHMKKKLKNQERKAELKEEDFQDDFDGSKIESHYKKDGGIDKVIVPRHEDQEQEDHRALDSKPKKNKKVKKF